MQDDATECEQQISEMDLVYKGAILTIVNAAAADANGELPGVRPGTRMDVPSTTLNCTTIALAGPSFDRAMAQSAWKTRAWTFQEEFLSCRRLIFTESQVFWECKKRKWWEDTIFESFDPAILVQLGREYAQFGLTPQNEDSRVNEPSRYNDMAPELARYGRLVERYTSRKLRFDGDALRAFSGILADLGRQLDGAPNAFHWGLPTAAFDCALFWDLAHEATAERREGFPSWSWTAWKSEIVFRYYPNSIFHQILLHKTVPGKDIVWYDSGSDTPFSTFAGHSPVSEGGYESGPPPMNWIPLGAEALSLKPGIGASGHNLRFWTSSAMLPIYSHKKYPHSFPAKSCSHPPYNGLHNCDFELLDRSRKPATLLVWMTAMLLCRHPDQWKSHVEAIVVSQRIVEVADKPKPKKRGSLATEAPEQAGTGTKQYERQLFTICIAWENGIAYRIGRPSCGIAEGKWLALRPTWKFIELG